MKIGNEPKIELTDVQLYKEGKEYYLRLKYRKENLNGIYEIEIPKVALGIRQNGLRINTVVEESCYFGVNPRRFDRLDLCIDSMFAILDNEEGYRIKETIIEEKKRKMTVSDIEKELGYKVEIISNK